MTEKTSIYKFRLS